MTLSDYISDVGDDAAAAEFKVTARTAASWRRGERFPRMEKAKEIEAISKGVVSFSECFDRPDKVAA